MSGYRARAPAKVNLGLFVGPVRADDGRHQLVTVVQSISLADELRLTSAPAGAAEDEVCSPGVPGPPSANLAAAALRSFRAATGWDAPPARLEIAKRVPGQAQRGRGVSGAASEPPVEAAAAADGTRAFNRQRVRRGRPPGVRAREP